jgi:hypothetical protein
MAEAGMQDSRPDLVGVNPLNLTIICVGQESDAGLGGAAGGDCFGVWVPVVIETEADMAQGRRLLRDCGGLTFILPGVTERPATHPGRGNLFAHGERDRFRAALLG